MDDEREMAYFTAPRVEVLLTLSDEARRHPERETLLLAAAGAAGKSGGRNMSCDA